MSGGGTAKTTRVTFVGGPLAGETMMFDPSHMSPRVYVPDGHTYDIHRLVRSDDSIEYVATPTYASDPLMFLLREYLECLKNTSAPYARRR